MSCILIRKTCMQNKISFTIVPKIPILVSIRVILLRMNIIDTIHINTNLIPDRYRSTNLLVKWLTHETALATTDRGFKPQRKLNQY